MSNHDKIYVYTRTLVDEKVVVICNLKDTDALYEYNEFDLSYDNLLLSNYDVKHHDDTAMIKLKPYEARLYKVTK